MDMSLEDIAKSYKKKPEKTGPMKKPSAKKSSFLSVAQKLSRKGAGRAKGVIKTTTRKGKGKGKGKGAKDSSKGAGKGRKSGFKQSPQKWGKGSGKSGWGSSPTATGGKGGKSDRWTSWDKSNWGGSSWKSGNSWGNWRKESESTSNFLKDSYSTAPPPRRGANGHYETRDHQYTSYESRAEQLPKNISGFRGTGKCIKISNCPPGLDHKELRDAFSEVGKVQQVELDTRMRLAYLVFQHGKHAYEAEHQFDGGEMNGSVIKITII